MDAIVHNADVISHGIAGKNPNVVQNAASHVLGALGSVVTTPFTGKLAGKYRRRNEPGTHVFEPGVGYVYVPDVHVPSSDMQPKTIGDMNRNQRKKVAKAVKSATEKGLASAAGNVRRAARRYVNRTNKGNGVRQVRRGRRKWQKGAIFGRNRRLLQEKISAPISERWVLNSGAQMMFSEGSKPGNLRIKGSYRIGTLSWNTGGFAVMSLPGNVSAVHQPIIVAWPWSEYYTNGNLVAIAELFERYTMTFRVKFVTGCATSDKGRIFAFPMRDPYQLNSNFGVSFANPTVPAEAVNITGASGVPGLIDWPVYKDTFTTEWLKPERRDDFKWMASDIDPDSVLDIDFEVESDARGTIAGFYVMGASGFVSGVSNTLGDVFMEYDIELANMLGVTNYDPPPSEDKKLEGGFETGRATSRRIRRGRVNASRFQSRKKLASLMRLLGDGGLERVERLMNKLTDDRSFSPDKRK